VLTGESAHQGHALEQRHGPDAQTDESIADIGREFTIYSPYGRGRADWLVHRSPLGVELRDQDAEPFNTQSRSAFRRSTGWFAALRVSLWLSCAPAAQHSMDVFGGCELR
jgi:hypothetical protein